MPCQWTDEDRAAAHGLFWRLLELTVAVGRRLDTENQTLEYAKRGWHIEARSLTYVHELEELLDERPDMSKVADRLDAERGSWYPGDVAQEIAVRDRQQAADGECGVDRPWDFLDEALRDWAQWLDDHDVVDVAVAYLSGGMDPVPAWTIAQAIERE